MKVAVGYEHEQYGMPVSLHGNMATICMFKWVLQEKHIDRLYEKGQ
mgnify:CR=1 FL=1